MKFYTIRLKRHPQIFVGKRSTSYALMPDAEIKERLDTRRYKNVEDCIQTDAHWFAPEKGAKVWTDLKSIKRLLTYCSQMDDNGDKIRNQTFSEYELLCNGKAVDMP